MKTAKGYYSLIQYCPDLARLEAANVGVLLFCPQKRFLAAKTDPHNARIRALFGPFGHDWQRINLFKRGLESRVEAEIGRLKSLDDLEQFIATRANEFQITPPRPMRVEDPERDLDMLFKELVSGEDRTRAPWHRVRSLLKQQLDKPQLRKKLKFNVMVTVAVLNRQVPIPYAFRNARFNLIQPVSFRSSKMLIVESTAGRYAVAGRSLYQQPDERLGELQLIVVGDFGAHGQERKELVCRILKENYVELFALDEVDRLVDKIISTARDIATDDAANPPPA